MAVVVHPLCCMAAASLGFQWASLPNGEVTGSSWYSLFPSGVHSKFLSPSSTPSLSLVAYRLVWHPCANSKDSEPLGTILFVFSDQDGCACPFTVMIGQGNNQKYPSGSPEFHTYSCLSQLCHSSPASYGSSSVTPVKAVTPVLACLS